MTISLYFHTLRFLKPVQFTGRILKRFNKLDCTVPESICLREPLGGFTEARFCGQSLLDDDTGFFLNKNGSALAWNDPEQDKLWLYNLHYFDDLNSDTAQDRAALHRRFLDRWIAENPAPLGNGWEPYPISLRVVNWIKWFLVVEQPPQRWLDSLALQVKVLSQSLEHHLLGNHLFANAKALLFAGLYFEGDKADGWRTTALKLLDREIPEQVLSDGGNFELSPMYHATITHDLLDLINIAQVYGHPETEARLPGWKKLACAMLRWLAAMSHPDGEVSFFNDSAQGVAPTLALLDSYAERLGIETKHDSDSGVRVRHLEASGYIRLELEDAVSLLDVAKVGPDYIPGHAHADSLSFELSVFGKRLVVNSGTSCYGTSTERLRQRGTAAHSTVVINGQNSSVVWGGFRVAQRAYPLGLQIKEGEGSGTVRCSHTGYRWLKGKPEHARTWQFGERFMVVSDSVSGRFEFAQARYHIHPDWVPVLEGCRLTCNDGDGNMVSFEILKGKPSLEESSYHPEFGRSILNRVLIVDFKLDTVEVRISW